MNANEPSVRPPDDLDESGLAALLEEAGPRAAVPEADLALLRAATHAAWQRSLAPTRPARGGALGARWRWRPVPALLAASLALTALLFWWLRPQTPAPAGLVASVEGVWGVPRLRSTAGAEPRPLLVGEELPAGSLLTTDPGEGGGRLALRLSSGHSVRLDRGTTLGLEPGSRIALAAGAVYVDSGSAERSPTGLIVATAAGEVRELGTQFEVRVEPGSALSIRVREGEVALSLAADRLRVVAGERLTRAADGSLARSRIDRADPLWQWAVAAAPAFAIEGRTLRAYLDWTCRENGWRLRFATPALAAEAGTIRLHGSVAGLEPDEALAVVLAGAGLTHRFEADELVVAGR